MRQDTRNRQIDEGGGHVFEGRKEPAGKNAAPGDDFPDRSDDNERKNISPNQPQALAALRSTGCMVSSDGSNGVLHLRSCSSHGLGHMRMSVGLFFGLVAGLDQRIVRFERPPQAHAAQTSCAERATSAFVAERLKPGTRTFKSPGFQRESFGMSKNAQKIGWIGTGRMGLPMAERLLKAGHDVSIWNRTRAKAEPLAAKGGKVVNKLSDLASCDVVFSIVSEGKDLEQVYFGKDGVLSGGKVPKVCVDCSTISVEESAATRKRLKERGADYVCAPVSGNAKVIKAGRLSSVVSGEEAACKAMIPLMEVIAPQGVSYVGEGDLARICKIAHNVMLGVVIENLIEITLLVNKMGVPRHAFLAFLNNGVMGSMFTRYKSPALVNLDWTTTFTPELLRKDLDLGLELGREMDVPMPVTAATREMLQAHFGAATLQADPNAYLVKDFAALMETMALAAGMKLTSENKNVPTGLES